MIIKIKYFLLHHTTTIYGIYFLKHSTAMFEFRCLYTVYVELHAPSPTSRADELLVILQAIPCLPHSASSLWHAPTSMQCISVGIEIHHYCSPAPVGLDILYSVNE